MRVWEFKDSQGYKWQVTEDNNNIKLEVMTFSTICPDWELVDQMKEQGNLNFVKEYELKEV